MHFYNSWAKFKWMKARVLHYSNSTATFNILVCGDIHPHPGPEHLSSRSKTNTNSTNRSVLHCYYQNVRSIKSGFKLKEFKDVVYSNKFDIVAISESWLTSDVSDSELLPWGYDIFRCDRKTLGNCGDTIRGGGVLLATRCDFGCKPVDITRNNNLEISAIEINTGNIGKVLVAVIYRPPIANTNWIYDFVQLLNECSYDKLILLGNFNFPAITWIDGSGFCDSSDSALFMFCQCLSNNNVFRLIEYPTRLNSCLDLLFSTIVERIINISDSEDFGVPSDHKAITFDVNLSIRTLNKNQQEMFNFKKADFEGLRTALRNDPPENYLDNDSNINDDWSSWKTFLFDKLGTFIPKHITRKFVSPP